MHNIHAENHEWNCWHWEVRYERNHRGATDEFSHVSKKFWQSYAKAKAKWVTDVAYFWEKNQCLKFQPRPTNLVEVLTIIACVLSIGKSGSGKGEKRKRSKKQEGGEKKPKSPKKKPAKSKEEVESDEDDDDDEKDSSADEEEKEEEKQNKEEQSGSDEDSSDEEEKVRIALWGERGD